MSSIPNQSVVLGGSLAHSPVPRPLANPASAALTSPIPAGEILPDSHVSAPAESERLHGLVGTDVGRQAPALWRNGLSPTTPGPLNNDPSVLPVVEENWRSLSPSVENAASLAAKLIHASDAMDEPERKSLVKLVSRLILLADYQDTAVKDRLFDLFIRPDHIARVKILVSLQTSWSAGSPCTDSEGVFFIRFYNGELDAGIPFSQIAVLERSTANRMLHGMIQAGLIKGIAIGLDNPLYAAGLDQEIAFKLIDARYAQNVFDHLDKFTGLNHLELFRHAFKVNERILFENLNKLSDLDYQDLVLELIDRGMGHFVVDYFQNFGELDIQEIGIELLALRTNRSHNEILTKVLARLPESEHQSFAMRMIEAGYALSYLDPKAPFRSLDYHANTRKIIEIGTPLAIFRALSRYGEGPSFENLLAEFLDSPALAKLLAARQAASREKMVSEGASNSSWMDEIDALYNQARFVAPKKLKRVKIRHYEEVVEQYGAWSIRIGESKLIVVASQGIPTPENREKIRSLFARYQVPVEFDETVDIAAKPSHHVQNFFETYKERLSEDFGAFGIWHVTLGFEHATIISIRPLTKETKNKIRQDFEREGLDVAFIVGPMPEA